MCTCLLVLLENILTPCALVYLFIIYLTHVYVFTCFIREYTFPMCTCLLVLLENILTPCVRVYLFY